MKTFIRIMGTIFILIPLIFFAKFIFLGDINFWYDSVRDLLSAWDNLSKVTLIGPPTGISGIFYGPYWIWLLSIGLAISKNPRVVVFLISFIPICLVFPYVLFKFSPLFKKRVILLTFLFFLYTDGFGYATTLWNPHPGLLMFLVLIYLIVFTNFQKVNRSSELRLFAAGVASGLMINFQMSLGICVFMGSFIFILIYSLGRLRDSKKKKLSIVKNTVIVSTLFLLGVGLTYAPFLFFEMRHGFNQIRTFIEAIASYGGVVNYRVLDQKEILSIFFGRFGYILHKNWLGAYILEILALIFLLWSIAKKRIKLVEKEKKLLLLIVTLTLTILYVYLTARNPVWEYHFLGTEVLFILLILFAASKMPFLQILLAGYILYSALGIVPLILGHKDPYTSSSLATKEYIVDIIGRDVKDRDYAVKAFSQSVYVYDYRYLFRWRYNKDVPFDPNSDNEKKDLIYLIIPKIKPAERNDFINYRTPNNMYETLQHWAIPDGTEIIKRGKKQI